MAPGYTDGVEPLSREPPAPPALVERLRDLARVTAQDWHHAAADLDPGLRADAEQAAFVALWLVRRRIAGMPAAQQERYASACREHATDRVAARERRHHAGIESTEELRAPSGEQVEPAAEPERLAEGSLLDCVSREDLHAALRELPPRIRAILELHFLWGTTDGDVAERTGLKEDTVKHRRDRILKRLRALLPQRE